MLILQRFATTPDSDGRPRAFVYVFDSNAEMPDTVITQEVGEIPSGDGEGPRVHYEQEGVIVPPGATFLGTIEVSPSEWRKKLAFVGDGKWPSTLFNALVKALVAAAGSK